MVSTVDHDPESKDDIVTRTAIPVNPRPSAHALEGLGTRFTCGVRIQQDFVPADLCSFHCDENRQYESCVPSFAVSALPI